MPTISPFTPQVNSTFTTANIVPSTSTSNVALPLGGGSQVRVYNATSVTCYIQFGTSTVTTSTSWGMPIASNNVPEKFTLDTVATGSAGSQLTYMAAMASVGTTIGIFVTRGEGF